MAHTYSEQSISIERDHLPVLMGAVAHSLDRLNYWIFDQATLLAEVKTLKNILIRMSLSNNDGSTHGFIEPSEIGALTRAARKYNDDCSSHDPKARPSVGTTLIATAMGASEHLSFIEVDDIIQSIEIKVFGEGGNPWIKITDPRVESMKGRELMGFHQSWIDPQESPTGIRPCFWIKKEGEWKSAGLNIQHGSYHVCRGAPQEVREMPKGPNL
jgi:hypothetical protein